MLFFEKCSKKPDRKPKAEKIRPEKTNKLQAWRKNESRLNGPGPCASAPGRHIPSANENAYTALVSALDYRAPAWSTRVGQPRYGFLPSFSVLIFLNIFQK